MKIVLHEQIPGLGGRGDIVDVSDGYARNSLIPKGLAQQATEGVTAQAEAMKRSWQLKNAKSREAAEDLAKVLVSKTIAVSARASGEGKLFGSVSAAEIAEAVKEQTGVELDRKMIEMEEAIRTTGSQTIMVNPHPEVAFPVTVEVAAS